MQIRRSCSFEGLPRVKRIVEKTRFLSPSRINRTLTGPPAKPHPCSQAVCRLYLDERARQLSSFSSGSGREHGEKSWSRARLPVLSSWPPRLPGGITGRTHL